MRYNNEINQIENCPNNKYQPRNYPLVYRWVYSGLGTSVNDDDMRPPAYRPRAAWPNDRVFKCEEFAVSMFTDYSKSVTRYKSIVKSRKSWVKRFGGFIAKGSLSHSDGLSCTPNKDSHFDIFENDEAEIHTKFTVIEEISI